MRRLCCTLAFIATFATPALADDWADCKGDDYDLVVTVLYEADQLRLRSARPTRPRRWAVAPGATRVAAEFDKALADWQACAAETPQDAYCPAGFADLAFAQANYDEAIKQADIAVGISPKYTWPMAIKGASLRLKGLYDQSIETLDQALKIDPRYTYAIYQRGLSLSNKEDYEKAISDYSKVLLIDKTYNDARSSRAYAYFAAGKLDKALADIDKVIVDNPNDHYSCALRGYMLVLQDNADVAKSAADLEKAISLSPTTSTGITPIGRSPTSAGQARSRQGRSRSGASPSIRSRSRTTPISAC